MKEIFKKIDKMSSEERIKMVKEMVKNLKPKSTTVEDIRTLQYLKHKMDIMDFYKGFKDAVTEKPSIRKVLEKLKIDDRFRADIPTAINTIHFWVVQMATITELIRDGVIQIGD